jgi:hypothetical protein
MMEGNITSSLPSSEELPSQYKTAEGMRTFANYLRSHLRVKSGIEHEKRVDYFKGKRLIECCQEAKKWPKSIPKLTSEAVMGLAAELLLQNNFFHRSEKVKEKKGYLKVSLIIASLSATAYVFPAFLLVL